MAVMCRGFTGLDQIVLQIGECHIAVLYGIGLPTQSELVLFFADPLDEYWTTI